MLLPSHYAGMYPLDVVVVNVLYPSSCSIAKIGFCLMRADDIVFEDVFHVVPLPAV